MAKKKVQKIKQIKKVKEGRDDRKVMIMVVGVVIVVLGWLGYRSLLVKPDVMEIRQPRQRVQTPMSFAETLLSDDFETAGIVKQGDPLWRVYKPHNLLNDPIKVNGLLTMTLDERTVTGRENRQNELQLISKYYDVAGKNVAVVVDMMKPEIATDKAVGLGEVHVRARGNGRPTADVEVNWRAHGTGPGSLGLRWQKADGRSDNLVGSVMLPEGTDKIRLRIRREDGKYIVEYAKGWEVDPLSTSEFVSVGKVSVIPGSKEIIEVELIVEGQALRSQGGKPVKQADQESIVSNFPKVSASWGEVKMYSYTY